MAKCFPTPCTPVGEPIRALLDLPPRAAQPVFDRLERCCLQEIAANGPVTRHSSTDQRW